MAADADVEVDDQGELLLAHGEAPSTIVILNEVKNLSGNGG
jgi:hypothetical protein